MDNMHLILIDFPSLKDNNEINSFINHKLLNFFPEPERLVFDYIVSGIGDNKKALVCYTLKDHKDNVTLHPFLLFRKLYRKDGVYRVFYGNTAFELTISDKTFQSLDYFDIEFNRRTVSDTTIISDSRNINLIRLKYSGHKIEELESCYRKCHKDLFKTKKRNMVPFFVAAVFILGISGLTYSLISKTNETSARLDVLKKEYLLVQSDTASDELLEEYNTALQNILNLESNISPDLYSIYYELNRWGDNYKILNMTYNNRYLSVVAIAENSIDLVEALNRSEIFDFKLNSTVRKEGFEQLSFSGEVLCP